MVEAPPDIEKYYRCFEAYIKKLPRYNHRISISVQRLSKLSINHLQELSNDIFDEITRRNTTSVPGHLSPRPDIHKKRNNARYQFGDLTPERIGDMCRDLVAELDRRFLTLRQDVPVPEIPPLHRTRTVRSAGAGAMTSSAASTPVLGAPPASYEHTADTSTEIGSPAGMKNLKKTEVVPTKSKMAMDSDEDDSPSEYEYYNPDAAYTDDHTSTVPAMPVIPSPTSPTRQNHSRSASALEATPPSSQPFSGTRRTPFEQRLAAATNQHEGLGFAADFNFEDQLPRADLHSDSEATELLSPSSVTGSARHALLESPVHSPESAHVLRHSLGRIENQVGPRKGSFGSQKSVGTLGTLASGGSMASVASPGFEGAPLESPLGSLKAGAEPDLIAYVNKLEDQVKELELINTQTIEENQQLHNMLADTETERKQIANEVKVLRETSFQSDNRSSTDTNASAHIADRSIPSTDIQKKLDDAEAKAARLEVRLNELTKEHQKLEDAHTKLETEHNSSRNTEQELKDKHQDLTESHGDLAARNKDLEQQLQELTESHGLLQEAHNNLRVVHDQHQSDYQALNESFNETLSRQVDPALNVEALAKEHESLLNRHNELDMKHASLESGHRTIKNEYAALQEAFSDLQTRYASVQNEQAMNGSHIPNGLNIRNLDTSDEYTRLLAQHNVLLGDLERQREVTEQVRKEAQRFLREMREMTESRSGQTLANFQKELANSEQQINYWKAKYQKTVEEMRSSRTRARESMLLQPSVMSDKFYDSNGLVGIEHVDKYQTAITDLLQATSSAPESILDYLHVAILSVEDILGEVAADDTRFAKEIRLVSNTAHQLISSTRNFAEASPVFPIGVITAACSDVSYAISEFLRETKVRHEEFVKYRPRSMVKNGTVKQDSEAPASVPRLPYSPTRADPNDTRQRRVSGGVINASYDPNPNGNVPAVPDRRSFSGTSRTIPQKSVASILPDMQIPRDVDAKHAPAAKRSSVMFANGNAQPPVRVLEYSNSDNEASNTPPSPSALNRSSPDRANRASIGVLQSPARMDEFGKTDLRRASRVLTGTDPKRNSVSRSPVRIVEFSKADPRRYSAVSQGEHASDSPQRLSMGAAPSLRSPVKMAEFTSNRDSRRISNVPTASAASEYTSTHTSPVSRRSLGPDMDPDMGSPVSGKSNSSAGLKFSAHSSDQKHTLAPQQMGDSPKESHQGHQSTLPSDSHMNLTRAASIEYSRDPMSPSSVGSASQVTFGTARTVDTTSPVHKVQARDVKTTSEAHPGPSGSSTSLNRPAAAPLRIDTGASASAFHTDTATPYTPDQGISTTTLDSETHKSKCEPSHESSREVGHEFSREPIREPTLEPSRDFHREPSREFSREPSREPVREHSRELSNEFHGEPQRQPIRESTRNSSHEPKRSSMGAGPALTGDRREPNREPSSESHRESIHEPKRSSLNVESTSPGNMLSPQIEFKADSTVAELQAYLEEQTSETVDSIRELLSGIKADSFVNDLKPRVDSIVYYVSLMVKTTGVCMKRTENWMLKDKGSFILQNLDDCCRRMASLRESLDHFEGEEAAPRPLKQRLAAVSFDIAKCTKELVKTVEDVSLKSELEQINARLHNANAM